jgi:hypothetical protein
MTTELTLTIDDDVIHSAGEYARTTGKSLTGIVENYLKSITAAQRKYRQLLPEVSQLMGVISLPDDYEYRDRIGDSLEKKYH